MLAPHLERIRALSWHTFSFTLPLGWEVTAYLLDENDGQLQLYERERFRGQLVWRKTPKRPDEARIMTEIHRRHLEKEHPERAKTFTHLTTRHVGDCLLGCGLEGEPFQASVYQPETKMLVQWVFPELGDDQLAVVESLLRSYCRNDDVVRRWELFGVGVGLPRELAFSEITPQPANVAIALREQATPRGGSASCRNGERDLCASITLPQLHRALLRRSGARIVSSESARSAAVPAFTRSTSAAGNADWRAHRPVLEGEAFLGTTNAKDAFYGLEQVGPPKRNDWICSMPSKSEKRSAPTFTDQLTATPIRN